MGHEVIRDERIHYSRAMDKEPEVKQNECQATRRTRDQRLATPYGLLQGLLQADLWSGFPQGLPGNALNAFLRSVSVKQEQDVLVGVHKPGNC